MLAYGVEIIELEAQPAAVVCAHVDVSELPAFLGSAFGDVLRVLSEQTRHPAGPPFARFRPASDGFDVEAGFPTDQPAHPAGRVAADELPGGPVARVLHTGDYQAVGAAYDAAYAWLTAHGYAPTGQPWESYLDGPEVPEPRTIVNVPCRER